MRCGVRQKAIGIGKALIDTLCSISADKRAPALVGAQESNLAIFLWSLPQPVFVFGCMLIVASAAVDRWADPFVVVSIILFLQFPLIMLFERIFTKRKEWLLNWREYAEDGFWVFGTYLVWIPLYERFYDTPIANSLMSLRESLGVSFALEANSIAGLFVLGLVASMASEFIGYWAHRLQHRYLLLWRIHATHHHITKMGVARADRTHPLEFLGLNLGGAIMFAFLGATPEVVAVSLVFRVIAAHMNHANLPLTSGLYGWVFTTAQWHQLHHSIDTSESDRNFGCTVILWDRLFGTFSGKTSIERLGNGTGQALSLPTQLSMPFRSNDVLKSL